MKPTTPVSRIRLAQPGERGANLYNGYHLLTQLAAVYAQMVELDHRAPGRVLLAELADSAMNDLGDVYTAWEQVLNSPQPSGSTLDDAALGLVVRRACVRVDAAVAATNAWTVLRKWVQLAFLAERRWQKLLAEFAQRESRLEGKLTRVVRASQDRASRLSGLKEKYDRESQAMARADQIERALRAEGERK